MPPVKVPLADNGRRTNDARTAVVGSSLGMYQIVCVSGGGRIIVLCEAAASGTIAIV